MLRPILVTQIGHKSYMMINEAGAYVRIWREYAGRAAVNHSIDKYVRKGDIEHTNIVENYFPILKRGINGTFHHVSQAHVKRYVGEFDFRNNARKMTDAARAPTPPSRVSQASASSIGELRSPSHTCNLRERLCAGATAESKTRHLVI